MKIVAEWSPGCGLLTTFDRVMLEVCRFYDSISLLKRAITVGISVNHRREWRQTSHMT